MDTQSLLVAIGVSNLALSAVVAWAASQKGRSAVNWFLLSLFLTPLFAVLVLLVVGARRGKAEVDISGPGTGPASTSVADGNVRAWKRQQQLDRIRPKAPPV